MTPIKKSKKNIKIVLLIAFIILTINILQVPELIKCDILTAKYGQDFENVNNYDELFWCGGNIKVLKVLKYTHTEAEVFYITTSEERLVSEAADIVVYERTAGEPWKVKYERRMWGGGGNVSKIVMPYWWYNFPALN